MCPLRLNTRIAPGAGRCPRAYRPLASSHQLPAAPYRAIPVSARTKSAQLAAADGSALTIRVLRKKAPQTRHEIPLDRMQIPPVLTAAKARLLLRPEAGKNLLTPIKLYVGCENHP